MKAFARRVAVVTGGANVIGRATASTLAKRGVKFVIADFDQAGLNEALAEIEGAGGEAFGFPCDISDDAAFPALRAATLAAYGRVDIVMYNVGLIAGRGCVHVSTSCRGKRRSLRASRAPRQALANLAAEIP